MSEHPNLNSGRGPVREEYQIYDREELVEKMASGTLTVAEAANIAMSMVNEKFSAPDKGGVKANVWGIRKRFCTGKELVLIH
jgi:hypothetical protein